MLSRLRNGNAARPLASARFFASHRLSCASFQLFKSSTDVGVPILVPVINENELVHDNTGLTINNGAFMVYER